MEVSTTDAEEERRRIDTETELGLPGTVEDAVGPII